MDKIKMRDAWEKFGDMIVETHMLIRSEYVYLMLSDGARETMFPGKSADDMANDTDHAIKRMWEAFYSMMPE